MLPSNCRSLWRLRALFLPIQLLLSAIWLPLTSTEAFADLQVQQVTNFQAPFYFDPESVISLNGDIYFSGSGTDSAGNYVGDELWKFDGVNVTLAADINPGSFDSRPLYLTAYHNSLYFQATDQAHSSELWAFDGQHAQLLKEFANSTTGSDPRDFTVCNNNLYFTVAPLGGGNRQLWQYDGANFSVVPAPAVNEFPASLTAHGNALFFVTYTAATGYELFKYDGINVLPVETKPGQASLGPSRLFSFNGSLFFVGSSTPGQNGIWTLTGSSITQVAMNLVPGRTRPLAVFQNALYFEATALGGATDLWKFQSNFQAVADINPLGTTDIDHRFATDQFLFFTADDGFHGEEVWVHDGVTTRLLADLNPGSGSSYPTGFFELNGTTYFFANDGTHGNEIWAVIPEPTSLVYTLVCSLALSCVWRRI